MRGIVSVFRVENAKGQGPYRADKLPYWQWNDADGPYNLLYEHPTPCSDEILKDGKWVRQAQIGTAWANTFSFCFSSIEQFREWFFHPDWIQAMIDADFVLNEYLVLEEEMEAGDKQSVFRKEVAELVKTIDLATFL